MAPWNDQILWVGRLVESKGIRTALRAMAELPPPMRLRILGVRDWNFLSRVESEIERLDLGARVSFAWVERRDLPNVSSG